MSTVGHTRDGLQKEQEENDPRCSDKENLVSSFMNVEQLVWLWNHFVSHEPEYLSQKN